MKSNRRAWGFALLFFALALQAQQWGFLLLEVVWALVSAGSLAVRAARGSQ